MRLGRVWGGQCRPAFCRLVRDTNTCRRAEEPPGKTSPGKIAAPQALVTLLPPDPAKHPAAGVAKPNRQLAALRWRVSARAEPGPLPEQNRGQASTAGPTCGLTANSTTSGVLNFSMRSGNTAAARFPFPPGRLLTAGRYFCATFSASAAYFLTSLSLCFATASPHFSSSGP